MKAALWRLLAPLVMAALAIGWAAVGRLHSISSAPVPVTKLPVTPNRHTRMLVLAPHCDDETLGAGGLIYQTLQAGGKVKVVVFTNGDGFLLAAARQFSRPWPGPTRQIRFARLRQKETRAAMRVLGLPAKQVTFLGYPDHGLMHLWRENWSRSYRSKYTRADRSPYRDSLTPRTPYQGRALLRDLEKVLAGFQPNLVVIPHQNDAHPDHWAASAFAALALAEWGRPCRVLSYLVHRGSFPGNPGYRPNREIAPPDSLTRQDTIWRRFQLSAAAHHRKREALAQYQTQLKVVASYLLEFLGENELFGQERSVGPLPVVTREMAVNGIAKGWWEARDGNDGARLPRECAVFREPIEDTLLRRSEPRADLEALAVGQDGHNCYLVVQAHSRLMPDVRYQIWIHPVKQDRPPMVINLQPPATALLSWKGDQVGLPAAANGDRMAITLPLFLIGADQVVISALSNLSGVEVDRSGARLVRLPQPGGRSISLTRNTPAVRLP